MSPLLDVQRRNQEIGRIRAGISEDTGRLNRKNQPIRRPVKLGTFALTSGNRRVIEAAAQLYGGQVEAWEQQWRVITPVAELPCSVPGGEAALNQAWEMWSGGVCVRRCDGVTEQLRQQPCMCPADGLARAELAKTGGACKAKSRINLILPDLPGLGVWRLETGSWNAALEIGGVIELLARAREAGTVIPAILRLDRRESKRLVDIGVRPDQRAGVKGERVEAREFYVPVLDVLPTMRELRELGRQPGALALPPPPEQMRAITAGRAPTPAYGVPVEAPAAWSEEDGGTAAEPPAVEPGSAETDGRPKALSRPTCPQDVADLAASKQCDEAMLTWLRNGAAQSGWLDEYVSLDRSQPDAPHDALRTVLDDHAARIREGR